MLKNNETTCDGHKNKYSLAASFLSRLSTSTLVESLDKKDAAKE